MCHGNPRQGPWLFDSARFKPTDRMRFWCGSFILSSVLYFLHDVSLDRETFTRRVFLDRCYHYLVSVSTAHKRFLAILQHST